MNNHSRLSEPLRQQIAALPGPLMVTGAGGFIGINLLKTLLSVRDDVTGVSRNPEGNSRIKLAGIPQQNLAGCDIDDTHDVRRLINNHRPAGIFNLAAYGAYSKQSEYERIYRTNFTGSVDLLEAAKEHGFRFFIQAGSSSEYGLNATAPDESLELTPNSHYAVSKVAVYHAIKYFGKIEKLPAVHLRLYSAYGPWEEPDRLIPVLIAAARHGKWPLLVNPHISRDFIHVDDMVAAFIQSAASMAPPLYGEAFNVGTGIKTSIAELCNIVASIFNISNPPVFGSMPDRRWDMPDWYANPAKINTILGWKATIPLQQGLKSLAQWQHEIQFDTVLKNQTDES